MKFRELRKIVAHGEDSGHLFKADVRNVDVLVAEMVAFANNEGGCMLIKVVDDWEIIGFPRYRAHRIKQLISSAARQHVRSSISPKVENVPVGKDWIVIDVSIPDGFDKPYFNLNGVIWLKRGPDKRLVNYEEELRRLFQMSDQFHVDELPTQAEPKKLDKLRFGDSLRSFYKQDIPESPETFESLLQNINLATDNAELSRCDASCESMPFLVEIQWSLLWSSSHDVLDVELSL